MPSPAWRKRAAAVVVVLLALVMMPPGLTGRRDAEASMSRDEYSPDAAHGCLALAAAGTNGVGAGAFYNVQVGSGACSYTAVDGGGYSAQGNWFVIVVSARYGPHVYSNGLGSDTCGHGIVRTGDLVWVGSDLAIAVGDLSGC